MAFFSFLPLLIADDAGKAVSVSGRVLVRNEEGNEKKMTFLKPGDSVSKGTVINTSSVGNVKILMTDKTVLDLGPSTLFKVKEYELKQGSDRTVNVEMDYGKIRASVNTPVGAKGKFTLKTKAATMGVRGTEFVVLSDLGAFVAPPAVKQSGEQAGTKVADKVPGPQTVQVTVIKGNVEVSTEQNGPEEKKKEPIKLTEGSQMTAIEKPVSKEEPAKGMTQEVKVVQLSKEELKTVVTLAKQEDKTFVQAVVVDNSVTKGMGGDTLHAFSSSFAVSSDYNPSTSNIGLPGTFGSDIGVRNNPVNRNFGAPVSVSVVFNNKK